MLNKKDYPIAQHPLLLRFHRLMDAFSKSDDERVFYLDRVEGFILYEDLDKGEKELVDFKKEIESHFERYAVIPKMTFYEMKKFMEGFVNEKVYDIDTKEKLLDIIQSKEARENFLEFIYDHLAELEKWQQYYIERMRIRIIEWLRSHKFVFVFEEDLDFPKSLMEKVKQHLFDVKVTKDVVQVREVLEQKAATYYSNEALNPRPKRGRPPKQQLKVEVELHLSGDIYITVPPPCRTFLYLPDITNASAVTFSSRYQTQAELLENLRGTTRVKVDPKLEQLSQRLQSLQALSKRLSQEDEINEIVDTKESHLLKAVSQQDSTKEDQIKQKAMFDVVKDFLPHKTTELQKNVDKSQGLPQKKAVKKVTPLQSKKKK